MTARRVSSAMATLLLALATLAVSTGCRAPGPRATPGLVAVHIARDAWREPHELLALIDGAAEVGCQRVVLEDRRDGTVVHGSAFEPWSEHLNGVDPGFDPVALALERARRHGLELYLAMQVVPVWSGAAPPREPQHPWHVLRAWRWVDSRGAEQSPRAGALLCLDPCLPEVRRYLASVIVEPARRYDVDGLVLVDARYPRGYPTVPPGNVGDPPQGARTRELYRGSTGLAPADDAGAWQRWRATQLTELVRLVRQELDALGAATDRPRPPLLVAEVLPDEAGARLEQQDWRLWLEQGLVDAVAPVDDGQRGTALARERRALWGERVDGGTLVVPVLSVPAGRGLDPEWTAEVRAVLAETGAVIVRGAEPWLRTALPDVSGDSSRRAFLDAVGW